MGQVAGMWIAIAIGMLAGYVTKRRRYRHRRAS